MPMSTTMLNTVVSAGTRCEIGARMPMVAVTLVAASSTGSPAAISAPNTSSMRNRVIGRLNTSAERRSSATRSSMASSSVRSPLWRRVELGVSGLDGLDGVDQRAGVVVVAGQLDGDQQRRPVAGSTAARAPR